jgi:hypothetical protein
MIHYNYFFSTVSLNDSDSSDDISDIEPDPYHPSIKEQGTEPSICDWVGVKSGES